MLKEDFMWALYFRHDCELFDESRKIPKADLEFILDAGRLSSSKGGARWKFVVARNPEAKSALRQACTNPQQISSSSAAVAILAFRPEPGTSQHHIAAANMMTAAAAIGIDSCPITGFDQGRAKNALGIESGEYEVAVILPLGYRIRQQPPKQYMPLSDLVEYR